MDYNEVLETKSLITKLIRIWRTWSEASENTSLTMAAETSMIWRCKKSSLCVELFSWRLRDYVSIGIFADNTSFLSSTRLAWTCSGPRGPSWEKFRHLRVQVHELIIEHIKQKYISSVNVNEEIIRSEEREVINTLKVHSQQSPNSTLALRI